MHETYLKYLNKTYDICIVYTYSIRSLVKRWKSVSYITVKLLPCKSLEKKKKKKENTITRS